MEKLLISLSDNSFRLRSSDQKRYEEFDKVIDIIIPRIEDNGEKEEFILLKGYLLIKQIIITALEYSDMETYVYVYNCNSHFIIYLLSSFLQQLGIKSICPLLDNESYFNRWMEFPLYNNTVIERKDDWLSFIDKVINNAQLRLNKQSNCNDDYDIKCRLQHMNTCPKDEDLFILCYKLNGKYKVDIAKYFPVKDRWHTNDESVIWFINNADIIEPMHDGCSQIELLGWLPLSKNLIYILNKYNK